MTTPQTLPLLPEGYERPEPPQPAARPTCYTRVTLDPGILPNLDPSLRFHTTDLPGNAGPCHLTAEGELHGEAGLLDFTGSLSLFADGSGASHQIHVVVERGLAMILSSLRQAYSPVAEDRYHTVDFEMRRQGPGPAPLPAGEYRLPDRASVRVVGNTLVVDCEPWGDLVGRLQEVLGAAGIEVRPDRPVARGEPVQVTVQLPLRNDPETALLWLRPLPVPGEEEAHRALGQQVVQALLRAGLSVAWLMEPDLPMLVR